MKAFDYDEFKRLRDSNFYDSFYAARTSKYKELDAFRSVYTPEFIKKMKLEDYVQGLGSTDSFCYHIERTFGCFGNISSSSAFKFGIFYSRSRSGYEYYPKWGDSAEEAFENVKDSILDLLKYGEQGDTYGIVNNMLAPTIKGKILHLYYPQRYFSIYSNSHLDFYLRFYKLDTISLIDGDAFYKQERLLEFKQSDPVMKEWSIDKFATFLYHVYPKSPNRQVEGERLESDVTKSLKREPKASFTTKFSVLPVEKQPNRCFPEIDAKLEMLDTGSYVSHKKFGEGEVVEVNKADKYIHVRFTGDVKKFVYPDAFYMGFLMLDDSRV